MPHLITLNEIGNNIDKHFQIRGNRVGNSLDFNIFCPRDIDQILGHRNIANHFDFALPVFPRIFKLFLLRAIKSYNLYHNWKREDLNEHINNIKSNVEEYSRYFKIPEYNWLNNKLNNYEELFNFMQKLYNSFYLGVNQNNIINYELSSSRTVSLFDFAFRFPNININLLDEYQIKQARLNYFNNCLGNLINNLPVQIFNHETIPQVRINNNSINNLRNIFDIEVPYTVDDFMNKIYIPNPDKMPPRIIRDDFDDLLA